MVFQDNGDYLLQLAEHAAQEVVIDNPATLLQIHGIQRAGQCPAAAVRELLGVGAPAHPAVLHHRLQAARGGSGGKYVIISAKSD